MYRSRSDRSSSFGREDGVCELRVTASCCTQVFRSRTTCCRAELGFGATPGGSPRTSEGRECLRKGEFCVLPQGTCVTVVERPAHSQVRASVCEHAARYFWYVAFGSDSFLICLTSAGIVICRILLISAEFSCCRFLPRPGVGVCRTAHPRLRRATDASATQGTTSLQTEACVSAPLPFLLPSLSM